MPTAESTHTRNDAQLWHLFAAAVLNLVRVVTWREGTRRAHTRHSALAAYAYERMRHTPASKRSQYRSEASSGHPGGGSGVRAEG